jgi:hypothetical protein
VDPEIRFIRYKTRLQIKGNSHGERVDTLPDVEMDARLFVPGEHYHAGRPSKIYLHHRVERVIRSATCKAIVTAACSPIGTMGFIKASSARQR